MSQQTKSYILPSWVLTMDDYRRHQRNSTDPFVPQSQEPAERKAMKEMHRRKEQVIIGQFDAIVRYMKEGEGPKYERFGRMAETPCKSGGVRRGRQGINV